MKRLSMIMVCLFAMLAASIGLKAQEISILLRPGWNWIGYPYPETVDLENAFGDFEPMADDVIESFWGYSEYVAGYGWFGGIDELKPGWGYMYYSNRTEVVSLVFAGSTPQAQVQVTTSEPMLITAISAMGGGEVTTTDGTYILVKGLCWAAHENPTTDDFYEESESGVGTFSISMTGLNIATTYYARAYAVTPNGTVYGDQKSFTTLNYVYVDLGLPSGTLWATCNVGAGNPEDYGDYFAWGETQPKDYYGWSTYQYCNGSEYTLTKYCNRSYYGYNGFTDNLSTLLPEDDAATANWGGDWRMPTKAEWQELLDNTTMTGTQQGGVNGRLFTASNGNSIFLPAAGYRGGGDLGYAGSYDYYWSSSLNTGYPYNTGGPYDAWFLDSYSSGYCGITFYARGCGLPVRAVRSGESTPSFMIDATSNPAEGGTVTGGGTYEQGQSCTLIATPNTGYAFTNWTEGGEVVSTNASYSFTVNADRTLVANFIQSGSGGDHAYVDLGLPSGLLWATCNVGATSPEEYGDYFAWGETQPKDTYNWSTYQYCMGSENTLTKYCTKSSCGYNGFTDNLTTLLLEDDAATANWGYEWRMPTQAEWQELYQNTTHTWTTQNGVNGRLFTATNGNSLFLPAAGYRHNSSLGDAGSYGHYWSSSLHTGSPYGAWSFCFNSDSYYMGNYARYCGQSVRAVRVESQN